MGSSIGSKATPIIEMASGVPTGPLGDCARYVYSSMTPVTAASSSTKKAMNTERPALMAIESTRRLASISQSRARLSSTCSCSRSRSRHSSQHSTE